MTETLTEMQVRIAREMQVRDAARADYWREMEAKVKGERDDTATR